jgi:hypothetical protein
VLRHHKRMPGGMVARIRFTLRGGESELFETDGSPN